MAELGSDYLQIANELQGQKSSKIHQLLDIGLTGAELGAGFTPFSPLVTGPAEFAKSMMDKKPLGEAVSSGAKAAALDALLTYGTMGLGKIPKYAKAAKAAKEAVEAGKLTEREAQTIGKVTRLKPWVVQQAYKHPQVLQGEAKDVADIGTDIGKEIESQREAAIEAYERARSAIPKAEGLPVSSTGVRESLLEKGYSLPAMGREAGKAVESSGLDIPESLMTRFIHGGNLSADEAMLVNSRLSLLLRNKNLDPSIARGLQTAKTNILNAASESGLPGIREVNEEFAKKMSGLERVEDITQQAVDKYTKTPKEARLGQIGQRLGGEKTRTKMEAEALEQFSKETGKPFADELAMAEAAREIERRKGQLGLGGYLAGSGGLLGLGYGLGSGDIAPALGGLATGAGLYGAMRPEMLPTYFKAAKAGRVVFPALGKLAKTGLAIKAGGNE